MKEYVFDVKPYMWRIHAFRMYVKACETGLIEPEKLPKDENPFKKIVRIEELIRFAVDPRWMQTDKEKAARLLFLAGFTEDDSAYGKDFLAWWDIYHLTEEIEEPAGKLETVFRKSAKKKREHRQDQLTCRETVQLALLGFFFGVMAAHFIGC